MVGEVRSTRSQSNLIWYFFYKEFELLKNNLVRVNIFIWLKEEKNRDIRFLYNFFFFNAIGEFFFFKCEINPLLTLKCEINPLHV